MKTEQLCAALAEALLRLVTDRRQASSVAGDLVECRRHGAPRFLRDLAGAVLGFAGQSIASMPLRAGTLLAAAATLWTMTYVGVRVMFAEFGWLALTRHARDCLVSGGLTGALLAAALILAGLFTGSLLGACVRNRALNPSLPLCGVFLGIAPLLILSDLASGALSWHCLVTYLLVIPLCYALPLLAGTALACGARSGQRAV